ncbi:MAG: hypothetical protein WD824_17280 [Cyclobacteriaceae bacterium]
MKNLLFLALSVIVMFSCSKSSRKISEPFPNLLTTDIEWITYEGILPSINGEEVLAELYLSPGAPSMDSYYELRETLIVPGDSPVFSMGGNSRGNYDVLFGSPGQNIIRITNRGLIGSIMRGKMFGPGDRVTRDLLLKSNGDHELVMVDKNFQQVNARYTLIRRSDLFTVEGYFTVYHDTTEYFERNTRKNWPVARFGDYDEAVNKYYSLAKEKHEGVYLKALSYSVSRIDKKGNEIDALVFKRILEMDSMKAIQ